MKAYLGLRDTDTVYATEPPELRFGLALEEHGFTRIRLG
jgi:hypothetical protein